MQIFNDAEREWVELIERKVAQGRQSSTIPRTRLSQDTAMALAEKLNVHLRISGNNYVFRRKQAIGPYLKIMQAKKDVSESP